MENKDEEQGKASDGCTPSEDTFHASSSACQQAAALTPMQMFVGDVPDWMAAFQSDATQSKKSGIARRKPLNAQAQKKNASAKQKVRRS